MLDPEPTEEPQGEGSQPVTRHAQPLHGDQPLQCQRYLAELVEGQAEVGELWKVTEFRRQGRQAVPVKEEGLQAGRGSTSSHRYVTRAGVVQNLLSRGES